MIALELGPDEVETAVCEWLRVRYRIESTVERVVVKRNGGVEVLLCRAEIDQSEPFSGMSARDFRAAE